MEMETASAHFTTELLSGGREFIPHENQLCDAFTPLEVKGLPCVGKCSNFGVLGVNELNHVELVELGFRYVQQVQLGYQNT